MAFEPVRVCVYVWRYLLYYFGFNRRTQQRVLAGIDYRLLASSDALFFFSPKLTPLSRWFVLFVFFLCFPPLTVCVCVCGFQNLRIKLGKRSSQSQPFEVIQGSTAQGMIPLESASHLFLRCYSGCNCYCFELCSTAILACHLFFRLVRTYFVSCVLLPILRNNVGDYLSSMYSRQYFLRLHLDISTPSNTLL